MDIFSLAPIQNPWWSDKKKITQDPQIKEYLEASLKYEPAEVLDLPLKEDVVHLITGPRQIGKTTSLKLLIENLLKETEPKNILYFNCDIIPSRETLVQFVLDYLQWRKDDKRRKFIFLDEISSVKDWPYGIKWLIDSGKGKKITFLLTGSTSINLIKAGEYLPGRRGGGKDIFLHPLKFSQVLSLFYPEFKPLKFSHFSQLKKAYLDLKLEIPDLEEKVELFLRTGGFTKIINEYLKEKRLKQEFLESYLDWFKSELAKNGKQEILIRQILEKIFSSLTTGISFQAISEYASLGSHNTAKDYLNFLKESFFLLEAPLFDITQKKVLWRKNKKYYLSDNFVFWLMQGYLTGNKDLDSLYLNYCQGQEAKSKLIENLVATEIAKRKRSLYYFSNQEEIDFVSDKDPFVFEVKYRTKVTPSDFKSLKKKEVKRGVVISKNDFFEKENIMVIPLSLFLIMK